jgi:hypothetical protein
MNNATGASALDKLSELKAKEQELLRRRISPRIVVEDITGEKMTAMLADHGETMASLSPDARSVSKIVMGKYQGSGTDEDPYIKGFSSDSTRQDRLGRPGAALDNPAITVAWGVQQDIFEQVFNHKVLAQSGLLPRFVVCRVEPDLRYPSFAEDSSATKAEGEFQQLVVDLLSNYRRHRGATNLISADPEARQVFIDYQREIHQRVVSGELSWISSFAMRWAEIAWRIALIFHCAQHGQTAHTQSITKSTATDAVRVMEWFARHQVELLERGEKRTDSERLSVALAFVNKCGYAGATADDLLRAHQALFENTKIARAALEQLQAEDAVFSKPSGKSRRFYRKSPLRK